MRKVSPIAIEESDPNLNFCSPKDEQNRPDSEQLTPEDIEEYHLLIQKQAELAMRIKEIENKKLNSGKFSYTPYLFIKKSNLSYIQRKLQKIGEIIQGFMKLVMNMKLLKNQRKKNI